MSLDIFSKLWICTSQLMDTYNFSVKVKLPKIGGIGPVNMLQLKSLDWKFRKRLKVKNNISKGVRKHKVNDQISWRAFQKPLANNAYKTASACIRPITDGICPESLLPCNDLPISNKSIKEFLKRGSGRPNSILTKK